MASAGGMTRPNVGRAAAVAFPVIALLLGAIFAAAFLLSNALGLPALLGLPAPVQVLGDILALSGVAIGAWVFRYRSPADMIVSTYITFSKIFLRTSLSEPMGRSEPLVVVGPQRYVRHPLYLGVIVMAFGWALVGGYTFVLVGAVGVLLWFWLVLIPFEERELTALFGAQYSRYQQEVPMLVPFTKRKR